MIPGDAVVAHDWTVRDLHQAALFAAYRYRSRGAALADQRRGTAFADRYAAAWSAAAEVVCAGPVDAEAVAAAARDAINALIHARRRLYGLSQASGYTARTASFAAFWYQPPLSGWEDAVVDRIALWQVWEGISPAHRRVLLALAEHGDQEAAAEALGTTYATYRSRLRAARKAFRALWHEGETVPGLWAKDRRSYRRGEALKGTSAGATRLIAARRRQRQAA